MNPPTEGTVLRESRVVSTSQKIKAGSIILTLLVLAGVGLYVWQSFQVSSSDGVNTIVESEFPLDFTNSGQLFFSANREDDEFGIPEIYTHNFESNTNNLVFDKPAYSYSKGNNDFDIAIGYMENSQDQDGYQPVSINKETEEMKALPNNQSMSETDLTFSADNQYYAYSFKTIENKSNSLEYWNVALYNYKTGEAVIIPSAAEPEFINDSTSLVYMTNDGLYIYSLVSNESIPLTNLYQNLTIIDDYVISNDSSTLVMTVPSLNTISVSRLNQLDGRVVVKEVKIIKSENVITRFPVISSDNKFYAVMAAQSKDFDTTTNSYTNVSAEIRSIDNSEVEQRVNFDGLKPQSVVLEEWTTF